MKKNIQKIYDMFDEFGGWEVCKNHYLGEDENGVSHFETSMPKIKKIWDALLPSFNLSGWGNFYDGGYMIIGKKSYFFDYANLETIMFAELEAGRVFGKKEIVERFFQQGKLPNTASARIFQLTTAPKVQA
jgi:hypothetical protein